MTACKYFAVYEKATGTILRSGTVPVMPADLDLCMARAQVNHDGEWYVESSDQIDPNKWRVALETGELVEC